MIDTRTIKQNVSPVLAIERYTGAKPSHNKYPCPFHNDKHPSLTVKGDHWRCWACGACGDVINFTMKYFGLSFKDACKKLSDDFGLVLANEIATERQREIGRVQEEIETEIQQLTTAHRVLFQLGYHEEAEAYAKEIDDLESYKQHWK